MPQSTLLDFQNDVVESIVMQKPKSYRAIQMQTFEALGSVPQDWKMCEIKDVTRGADGYDIVDFIFPEGYTEVPHTRFHETTSSRCQLCGHPIARLFYLQNDQKKLILQVGSECVNTYVGAGYTEKAIKVFKDNRIRQNFRIWREKALDEIYKRKQISGWLPYEFYQLQKKLQKVDDLKSTCRVLFNLMNKYDDTIQGRGK